MTGRAGAEIVSHHRILGAVPDEDRQLAVRGTRFPFESIREQQVARKGDQSGEAIRVPKGNVQRHGPALASMPASS